MSGVMFLVARRDDQLPVIPLSTVGIFPCIGAIDRDADAVAAHAFAAGGYESVRSLRRDRHEVDQSCWLHSKEVCLSKRE
jgi:protein-L-isoaspartate(D-aspartate) O-methyltransferase